jgi:hypothetical protein
MIWLLHRDVDVTTWPWAKLDCKNSGTFHIIDWRKPSIVIVSCLSQYLVSCIAFLAPSTSFLSKHFVLDREKSKLCVVLKTRTNLELCFWGCSLHNEFGSTCYEFSLRNGKMLHIMFIVHRFAPLLFLRGRECQFHGVKSRSSNQFDLPRG